MNTMKHHKITFASTTYRTYTVEAEDLETAEEMAQGVLQNDAEVSKEWRKNAQIENQTVGAFGVEDVMGMRSDLSKQQALQVIHLASKRFDASLGINWDTLGYWATELFPEGEVLPED